MIRLHRMAVVALFVCGCGAEEHDEPPEAERQSSESATGVTAASGRATADSGALPYLDRWPGLRVEAMELRPEVVDSFGWSGHVRFSGSLRLSGRYRPHPSYPEVQELCFYPDSSSAARLPRLPNDLRTSWFCFSNQERARAELAPLPATGEATIVIDGFEYLYQHTDSYNTARLQEVVSRP